MSNIINSLYNIRLMDELAKKDTYIHRIHPLVKLLTTMGYLIVVMSFGRYEASRLLPFVFYPVLVLVFAELPVLSILKRLLLVLPLILGIGILNPLFDHSTVVVGQLEVSRGWITFLSISIRGGLTVAAGILLVATTGMDRLAAALRTLKVPKIFVLQLLLTYRYLSVLMEEVSIVMRAYSLRAPGQRGIKRSAWGSFAGQILLRTLDRGQRVYQAMRLRGFTGEYAMGDARKVEGKDYAYLVGWSMFFIIARINNLPVAIGALFTGGMG